MKFQWEDIYDNSLDDDSSYFEVTCRAKVIGGWLVRHETFCDRQYGCRECDIHKVHQHIDKEGYQNVRNVITFVNDPKHEWTINNDECISPCKNE